MMGDWAASSSSLSSLSCTTGAHCSISVDYTSSSASAHTHTWHVRARALCTDGGRTERLTSTVSGGFEVSVTMLDTPAARLARRVRSTRRRRKRRISECMASSARRTVLDVGVAGTSGGGAPTQTRSRSYAPAGAGHVALRADATRAVVACLLGARLPLPAHCLKMYPTQSEKAVVDAAEKLMTETMARYDPSHDAFHGAPAILYHHSHHRLSSHYCQYSASGGQPCT